MTRLFAAALIAATPALAAPDCALVQLDGGVLGVPCGAFVTDVQRTAHSFSMSTGDEAGNSVGGILDSRSFGPLFLAFDRANGTTLYVADGVAVAEGYTAVEIAEEAEGAAIIATELDRAFVQAPEVDGLRGALIDVPTQRGWVWTDDPVSLE